MVPWKTWLMCVSMWSILRDRPKSATCMQAHASACKHFSAVQHAHASRSTAERRSWRTVAHAPGTAIKHARGMHMRMGLAWVRARTLATTPRPSAALDWSMTLRACMHKKPGWHHGIVSQMSVCGC